MIFFVVPPMYTFVKQAETSQLTTTYDVFREDGSLVAFIYSNGGVTVWVDWCGTKVICFERLTEIYKFMEGLVKKDS